MSPQLPTRWPWFINGFRRYVKRLVRKRFHAVRVSKSGGSLPTDSAPILFAMNHPSWWDPMIGAVIVELFPSVAHYIAIDAAMLKKYKGFDKLGFFGVDTGSLRGAVEFLKMGELILSENNRSVWITAQGEFADVRRRPLELKSGVGHLAARLKRGWIIPVAFEYAFWNESQPEALVRFGVPLNMEETGTGKEWTARVEHALTETLDVLNRETQARDPAKFDTLLGGPVGVGGAYDFFRRIGSWFSGKKFEATHATPEKPA